MLGRLTWAIRAGAWLLIVVLTFAAGPRSAVDVAVQSAAVGIALASLIVWWLRDLEHLTLARRGWLLGLSTAGAVTGFAATTHGGAPILGLAIIVAAAVGGEFELAIGLMAAGLSIIAIETGSALRFTDAARGLGMSLLVVVAFVVGRNRAAYRVQAEQAAAIAEQAVQLRAEQRRSAVLDERARIAREIHDVLAHSLGALGIQIQAARALLREQNDLDRAADILDRAQGLSREGLIETRRAIHSLRAKSGQLDQLALELVEEHCQRHHQHVDLTTEGDASTLSPEVTVALLRTLQEALVNSAKHAPAQPVSVSLTVEEAVVLLVVSNELPSGAAEIRHVFHTADGGYGLTGLRERLELVNGTLQTATDDRSWTVTAKIDR